MKRYTIEALFAKKAFEEKLPRQPRWMKDGERLAYLDNHPDTERLTLWMHDTRTRESAPFLDPETLRLSPDAEPVTIHALQWSDDERLLLIPAAAPARFSPCGDLYLYDLVTHSLRRLTQTEAPQRNPKFSPDGKLVGLVRGDDLWTIDVATGEERQLTHDASPTRYNGRFGWVYEEELALVDGWVWSPDGSRILYIQQDEANVPLHLIPRYGEPHAEPEETRYPNAGDSNPTARAGILDLATGATRWIALGTNEHYIASFQWSPDGSSVLLQRLPRQQSRLELLKVDAETLEVTPLQTETAYGWVECHGPVQFLGKSDRFAWLSERNGNTHLYLGSLSKPGLQNLSTGPWDVAELMHVDEQSICFTATTPRPADRSLMRLRLDETGAVTGVERIASPGGTHRALFTDDGARFYHVHSSLSQPPRASIRKEIGELLYTLVEDGVPEALEYERHAWEIRNLSLPGGRDLCARMLRPAGFDPARRYPALMCVYGGPNSQLVLDAWPSARNLWHQALAEMGYLVFIVDGRGTGGRGRDFKRQVYQRLGDLETQDQLDAARWLAEQPYVDAARLGIWGWSYGGYMALNCLCRGNGLFKAGVSVAPVTDWHLYDTIYTEGFMRRPQDNPDGYRDTAPKPEDLKGRLLLVHGLSDDNVHFQNSARFAEALQKANIQFETMFYPGKKHGIEEVHPHLYRLFEDFLRRNL